MPHNNDNNNNNNDDDNNDDDDDDGDDDNDADDDDDYNNKNDKNNFITAFLISGRLLIFYKLTALSTPKYTFDLQNYIMNGKKNI